MGVSRLTNVQTTQLAPVGFGLVQIVVNDFNQLVGRNITFRAGAGGADTDGDAYFAVVNVKRAVGNQFSQAFCGIGVSW